MQVNKLLGPSPVCHRLQPVVSEPVYSHTSLLQQASRYSGFSLGDEDA
ncbi:MAG: hypothetical protein HY000_41205 [Planctomycetes bacterium]|nr:hypothetical protein [Planctomycetota bacterium]